MIIDIDPLLEHQMREVARWYGVSVDRYAAIAIERAITTLRDECPQITEVIDLDPS